MIFRFKFFLPLAFLTGCSIYQSSGRKQLEASAYDLKASAKQSLTACGEPSTAHQDFFLETENVWVTRADLKYEVILKPHAQFSCSFSFASKNEALELLPSAINVTLDEQN